MAQYTYKEPWTEGFNRLANTVYQILEARNQKAMQDQVLAERQRKIQLEDKAIKTREEFLKQARTALAPQPVTVQDPSKAPGMGAGMLRPEFQTTQVQQELSPQQKVEKLIQLAMQSEDPFGAVKEVSPMMQLLQQGNKPADSNIMARYIQKPGPSGKTHYFGFNPDTNLYDRDLGPAPEEQYKFTGASIFRGADNNLWRLHPSTGDPEMYSPGKGWVNNPNAEIPDFVNKELGRPPASIINQGVQMDTIRGNLARVRQNYNPDWVGPIAGRAYRAQEALTGLADNNQSMFYADVRDLADMLLRARSGAQINEQEYARLSKLVPTPDLPPKVFKERLNRFETQLLQALEAQESRLRKGRYLAPTKTPMSPEMKTESKTGEIKVGDFIVREKK